MLILAVGATLLGGLGSLCLITLLVAGSPTSSPSLLARIRRAMLASTIGGLGAFAGAIALMAAGSTSLAAAPGGSPCSCSSHSSSGFTPADNARRLT